MRIGNGTALLAAACIAVTSAVVIARAESMPSDAKRVGDGYYTAKGLATLEARAFVSRLWSALRTGHACDLTAPSLRDSLQQRAASAGRTCNGELAIELEQNTGAEIQSLGVGGAGAFISRRGVSALVGFQTAERPRLRRSTTLVVNRLWAGTWLLVALAYE